MQFKAPHQLTQAAAVARVKEALARARRELKGQLVIEQEEWEGGTLVFACVVQGQRLTGQVVVGEHDFDITVKLPLALRLFEGRIKKAIEEQTKAALGK